MGVKLMVEVLEHCPAEASLGERLLLVALAEKASDETRRVLWAREDSPREVLCRRLGVSASGLTKIFRRLSTRGLDPRVELSVDKRGRPVYAYEGSAAEYVIPTLRACPTGQALVDNEAESLPAGPPSSGLVGAPSSSLDRTTGQPLQPESLPDGAGHIPPSLEDPSIEAHSLPVGAGSAGAALVTVPAEHRAIVLELITRHGREITEDDAVACVAWVVAHRRKVTNLGGYLSRFTADDIRTRAAEHRGEPPPPDPRLCDHGVINGRQVLGIGTNASRRCDRCEQVSPADTEPQERAS